MKNLHAALLCDFYKISHREQYPDKTEVIYSTWTPRSAKYLPDTNTVVAFGFQGFIKEYLIDFFQDEFFSKPKDKILSDYARIVKFTLGVENPDTTHIAELHDLGYLPLKISAVKEGSLVPLRVPMLTVQNTDSRFFWLTNYIETLMSCELWQSSTSATIARKYRGILDLYAMRTTGSIEGVEFQGHDFSMRGMGGVNSAAKSGSGHLLSFVGTDTIPAIMYLEEYYGADIEKELVGCSVPATEHSVMCAGGDENEFETYSRLINKVYPTGIVSIVSDTWDLWKVLTDIIEPLKEDILSRDGGPESLDKVVIRPDSGDPVSIICGDLIKQKWQDKSLEVWKKLVAEDMDIEFCEHLDAENPHHSETEKWKFNDKYYSVTYEPDLNRHDKQYYYVDNYGSLLSKFTFEEYIPTLESKGVVECLWDIFGGTITDQGYKLLDSHIGVIYGDAITLERCESICSQLEEKGFASLNVVFGIGSYTYQYNTRDTLGFAMKSTLCVIDGKEYQIFKDPITDDGIKKSAKGAVRVEYNETGVMTYTDGLSLHEEIVGSHGKIYVDLDSGLLEPVFKDGKLLREQTLSEIRELMK